MINNMISNNYTIINYQIMIINDINNDIYYYSNTIINNEIK